MFVERDWHSIEDQIQLPWEPRWSCIGAPEFFSEMAEQQSPRQQNDPRARKHFSFLPLSFTANKKGEWKAKQAMEEERREKNLQNSSYMLGL